MTANFRHSCALIVLSVIMAACGESGSKTSDSDLVSFPGLSIKLKEGEVSTELKALAADINAGNSVSFKTLTTELARIHKASSLDANQTSSPEETLKLISEISAGSKVSDPHTFKVEIETKLGTKLNKELKYNKAATSVTDVLKIGKLQCYSASSFFDLALRQQMSGAAFDAANQVMIYEEGHVLPGYVKDGQLYGIEMTAKGKAQISYGVLKDHQFPLRLVDAGYWAVVEIFKTSATNTTEMASKAFEATAKKYNVALSVVNRPETATSPSAASLPTVLNSSPFAFGTPVVPEADIERETMNDSTQRNQRGHPGRRGGLTTPPPGGGSQEIIQFVSLSETQTYPEQGEAQTYPDLELSLGVDAQSLALCFQRSGPCDLIVLRAPSQPYNPLSILRFMMEDPSNYGTLHLEYTNHNGSFYSPGRITFPGLGELSTQFLLAREADHYLIHRVYYDSENQTRAWAVFQSR